MKWDSTKRLIRGLICKRGSQSDRPILWKPENSALPTQLDDLERSATLLSDQPVEVTDTSDT